MRNTSVIIASWEVGIASAFGLAMTKGRNDGLNEIASAFGLAMTKGRNDDIIL